MSCERELAVLEVQLVEGEVEGRVVGMAFRRPFVDRDQIVVQVAVEHEQLIELEYGLFDRAGFQVTEGLQECHRFRRFLVFRHVIEEVGEGLPVIIVTFGQPPEVPGQILHAFGPFDTEGSDVGGAVDDRAALDGRLDIVHDPVDADSGVFHDLAGEVQDVLVVDLLHVGERVEHRRGALAVSGARIELREHLHQRWVCLRASLDCFAHEIEQRWEKASVRLDGAPHRRGPFVVLIRFQIQLGEQPFRSAREDFTVAPLAPFDDFGRMTAGPV